MHFSWPIVCSRISAPAAPPPQEPHLGTLSITPRRPVGGTRAAAPAPRPRRRRWPRCRRTRGMPVLWPAPPAGVQHGGFGVWQKRRCIETSHPTDGKQERPLVNLWSESIRGMQGREATPPMPDPISSPAAKHRGWRSVPTSHFPSSADALKGTWKGVLLDGGAAAGRSLLCFKSGKHIPQSLSHSKPSSKRRHDPRVSAFGNEHRTNPT